MAELKIISMEEVQSKEVNWLCYPYIPYGKITIIQGDPGEGKTTLALRLAALFSKGEALPYDNTERELLRLSIKLPRTDWKIPSSRDWKRLRQTVRKSSHR